MLSPAQKITGVTFADRADIGVEAFAFTTDLTEVELPHPADPIKAGTFKFSGLQRIVIGNGAKFIGAEALGDASDITLPPTIEFLGANALPQGFANGIEAEDGIVYVGKVAYQSRGDQSSYAVKEGTLSLSRQVFG